MWPLIALCLAWPTTPLKVWTGNPVIWCVAAMAVSIVWRGGAPFALLKPSLFPFALFGIGQRAWWIGLAIFVALCLPFGAMWFDWLTTVVNARGAGPPLLGARGADAGAATRRVGRASSGAAAVRSSSM